MTERKLTEKIENTPQVKKKKKNDIKTNVRKRIFSRKKFTNKTQPRFVLDLNTQK